MIYFIQDSTTHHIKIGYSDDDPDGRRKDFQTGNPSLLDRGDEHELHRRFAEYHHSGEWFRPGPKLLAFMLQSTLVAVRPADHFVEEHITRAEELCRIAPPGPWLDCDNTIDDCRGVPFIAPFSRRWEDEGVWGDAKEFIAESRELLPALLAECKRLRGGQ